MRVLIAPDSFKGSISAKAAARAIGDGWKSIRPDDEIVIAPLADGGEGTLDAIQHVRGGELVYCSVLGPDNVTVLAKWLLLDDGTAVVELASASGLPLLTKLAPLTAHTFGFGQLLRDAANHPRTLRIVATVGGSASTDGGAGALAALGVQFLDASDIQIGLGGEELLRLHSVDTSKIVPPPSGGVMVLADVKNQLTGAQGSAEIFGPQKGATARDIASLDLALSNYAKVIGVNGQVSGAGAAGGAAFGLLALWGAEIHSGSDYIFKLMGIDKGIESSDLVISGEGALDDQSWNGKVIGGISGLCKKSECPLWLIVGINSTKQAPDYAQRVFTLRDEAPPGTDTRMDPSKWLELTGLRAALSIS